ncbi:hypothetical protein B3286c2_0037 [Brucella vulpis]|nr:hypothetical protein BF3285c2_0037 [Brucella vulpis]CUW51061.1 hypothetical protein B3286c2_0037 [Brucella vulpis]
MGCLQPTEPSVRPRVSLHAPPVLRATAGGREANMSNIIFWTALVVVPILVGTAYAYLRHFHHEDDF